MRWDATSSGLITCLTVKSKEQVFLLGVMMIWRRTRFCDVNTSLIRISLECVRILPVYAIWESAITVNIFSLAVYILIIQAIVLEAWFLMIGVVLCLLNNAAFCKALLFSMFNINWLYMKTSSKDYLLTNHRPLVQLSMASRYIHCFFIIIIIMIKLVRIVEVAKKQKVVLLYYV